MTLTASPSPTASIAVILPPFSRLLVLRPLPTNLVVPSTVNVISLLPAAVIANDVALTDFTTPVADIDFGFACACSGTDCAATHNPNTVRATTNKRFIPPS